jgi:acyl-CoA thioesterase I
MYHVRRRWQFSTWTRRARAAALLLPCAFLLVPLAANSQAPPGRSPAETCLAVNRTLSLGTTLPRTAAILKSGHSLKIVAIGSSSTVGLWVTNAAATYPGVMQSELTKLRPGLQIEIINSGRVGDTIPGNIARFDRDVMAYSPDIVVWQLGTNDVTWGRTRDLKQSVVDGVQLLRAGGADLILMDEQYAPVVLTSHYSAMQAIIADVAQQKHVALFSRFDLMRRSVEAGLSISTLVAWDGLHNSKEGYDCVGRALARAILASAH